jgi:hypothetical protein
VSRPSSRALTTRVTLLVLAALVAPLAASAPPAAAEVDQSTVSLRLVTQPVWHRLGDPLGIRLRVANAGLEPLENFTLSVAVHSRVSSRSALHASFDGSAGLVAGATSLQFENVSIPPGERRTIPVDLTTDDLPGLASATEGGVYPLTLTLGVGGVPLDDLVTPLIYYPEAPDTPLNLVVVLPLNDIPSRAPDGRFVSDDAGSPALVRAVSPAGWLDGWVDNLETTAGELEPTIKRIQRPRGPHGRRRPDRIVEVPTPSIHLGIAPTPRVLEELADLANGYRLATSDGTEQVRSSDGSASDARSVLSRLTGLLKETGAQPLPVPYSFPDLPALTSSLPVDRTSLELTEGAEVLRETLDADPGRSWLFAPAGRLDGATLGALQRSGVEHSFFSPEGLENPAEIPDEGCPEAFASFTCAIAVRTTEGPTSGFVSDGGLQDRLADLSRGGDDTLDLQRFFAETAAIRQEIPSVPDRVAQATIPSLWHPKPALSMRFLEGLRTAPWLQTVSPTEGLSLRDLETRPRAIVSQISPLTNQPQFDYFNTIEDAAERVSHFDLLRPPSAVVGRLVRNTLLAQSRLWWNDTLTLGRGLGYAQATVKEVDAEMSKITLGTPDQIRLTSRQGEVPLVVFNETGYPVTIDIRVVSQQLGLDLELEPSLLEDRRIEPDSTNQFTIRARARSSGIFPLEIRLETPDGYPISSKEVTVTSTEFNEIALGITIGAFTFLVLFYVTRALRRRRARPA